MDTSNTNPFTIQRLQPVVLQLQGRRLSLHAVEDSNRSDAFLLLNVSRTEYPIVVDQRSDNPPDRVIPSLQLVCNPVDCAKMSGPRWCPHFFRILCTFIYITNFIYNTTKRNDDEIPQQQQRSNTSDHSDSHDTSPRFYS